jgi:hypothetical protein
VLYLNKKLNSNSRASFDGCRWMIGNENRYWADSNESQGSGPRLGSSCVCGQRAQDTDCSPNNGRFRCKTTDYICKQIKTGGISGSVGRGTRGGTTGVGSGFGSGCFMLFGNMVCPGGSNPNPGTGGSEEPEESCWKCPGPNCDKCGTASPNWCTGHSGDSQACKDFMGQ